ncbi:unnamed protein product [Anisakis simplex]|uniref:Col_cuticle_N domain-containing protein n=1 Tax=Anisakis simplex TaxID=6269 RepID=A0A0M3K7G3_ANISI|nr:unnamed protein product [Anisakis simplex]
MVFKKYNVLSSLPSNADGVLFGRDAFILISTALLTVATFFPVFVAEYNFIRSINCASYPQIGECETQLDVHYYQQVRRQRRAPGMAPFIINNYLSVNLSHHSHL